MTTIRLIRNSILIGATVLGMAAATLPAQAQVSAAATPATQQQMHAKWEERRAARQANMAQRQAKLHDKLALTAAQEAAWAGYTAALKPAERLQRGERGAWKSMSAPERMQKRIEMSKARTAHMESRLAALNSLYAALRPEQRKVFDEAAMQRGGHRKHGMHRGAARMQG